MNEDEARDRTIAMLDVPRGTVNALDRYVALIMREAASQNLLATSTLPHIWHRHMLDAAQLLALFKIRTGGLVDLGAGAGIPGLVLATAWAGPVTLVEPRTKRATFLSAAVAEMGLRNVEVRRSRVESLPDITFDAITARAFAPLVRLLPLASRLAGPATRWVLPKGRSAAVELAEAERSWQGAFRLVPSHTDPDAAIIVADDVKPIGRERRVGTQR